MQSLRLNTRHTCQAAPRPPLRCCVSLTAPAASCKAANDAIFDKLLDWTRHADNLRGNTWAVEIAEGTWGRCLMAKQHIDAGQIILEVPFTKVFKSDAAESTEMHWAAGMALQLLQEQHKCQRCSSTASAPMPSSQETAAEWCPWIQSLPQDVITPLSFTDAEVAALGDPGVISEVHAMQQCIRDCHEVLQPQLQAIGCTWDQFLWAVQVFTSRCFFEPSLGCHLAVPGVDMANHSFQPNAAVQIRHSVEYCQGREALEEVCDPPPPSPSMFQLVAGPEGISAGEVTICYGACWPNEAFLLLFGFAPDDNPADAVVLFPSLEDLAEAYAHHLLTPRQGGKLGVVSSVGSDVCEGEESLGTVSGQGSSSSSAQGVVGAAEVGPLDGGFLDAILSHPPLVDAMESGEFDRLVVTSQGIDARASEALHLVQNAVSAACSSPVQPAVQQQRQAVQEAARQLPTSAQLQQLVLSVCQQRLAMLQGAGVAAASLSASRPAVAVAAQFRRQKERILEQVVMGLTVTP